MTLYDRIAFELDAVGGWLNLVFDSLMVLVRKFKAGAIIGIALLSAVMKILYSLLVWATNTITVQTAEAHVLLGNAQLLRGGEGGAGPLWDGLSDWALYALGNANYVLPVDVWLAIVYALLTLKVLLFVVSVAFRVLGLFIQTVGAIK